MLNRILITGAGIYGLPPSGENPLGEYPIGFEFDTEADLPAGWVGRAEIVRGKAADDAVLIGNGEPGPLDHSVDDLAEYLKGVTDADEVQGLIDAETAGKSRKSALAALEARRDELLAA